MNNHQRAWKYYYAHRPDMTDLWDMTPAQEATLTGPQRRRIKHKRHPSHDHAPGCAVCRRVPQARRGDPRKPERSLLDTI